MPILLDHPDDRAAALKKAQPLLGWLIVDGHVALPWSVFQRLVTPALVRPHSREAGAFSSFPHAEVYQRAWHALVGRMDLEAEDIFAEAVAAISKVDDQTSFTMAPGETWAVEGITANDDGANPKARWVAHMQVGMLFRSTAEGPPNLSASDLYYYLGPYFLTAYSAAGTPWAAAAKIIGKSLEADEDVEYCDGSMQADNVATGMADTAWKPLFSTHTEGWDAGPGDLRGGARLTNLLMRFKYAEARRSKPEEAGGHILALLPAAVVKRRLLPLLSVVCAGTAVGVDIKEAVTGLASHLKADKPSVLCESLFFDVETRLAPLALDITKVSFAKDTLAGRLELLRGRITDTRIGASDGDAAHGGGKVDGGSSTGGELLRAMTTPNAIAQLQRLEEHKASEDYSFAARVEMAHSGRPTPEQRAAALVAAGRLTDRAAKAKALADVKASDGGRPLAPVWQLMYGTVKAITGFPELLDLYDVSKGEMARVHGTVVARAFSASGSSVPAPLRHLVCPKLAASMKIKEGGKLIDIINDADGAQMCHAKGVEADALMRVPADKIYTDLYQVIRCQRIVAALMAFYSVRPDGERSWRTCAANCLLAFQWIPIEDMGRQRRMGLAMRKLFTSGLEELFHGIDKVRYSTKCDAEPPTDFLASGKDGLLQNFQDGLNVLLADMERDRSEDEANRMMFISVPRLSHSAVGLHFEASIQRFSGMQATATSPGPYGPPMGGTPDGKRVRINPPPSPGSPAPPGILTNGGGTLVAVELTKLNGDKVTVYADTDAVFQWYRSKHPRNKPCFAWLFAAGKNTKFDPQESCGKEVTQEGHQGALGHCHHTGDGWFAERKAVCKLSQADEAKMAHW